MRITSHIQRMSRRRRGFASMLMQCCCGPACTCVTGLSATSSPPTTGQVQGILAAPEAGGTVTLYVFAPDDCDWGSSVFVYSGSPHITITSITTGTGNGTVTLSVAPLGDLEAVGFDGSIRVCDLIIPLVQGCLIDDNRGSGPNISWVFDVSRTDLDMAADMVASGNCANNFGTAYYIYADDINDLVKAGTYVPTTPSGAGNWFLGSVYGSYTGRQAVSPCPATSPTWFHDEITASGDINIGFAAVDPVNDAGLYNLGFRCGIRAIVWPGECAECDNPLITNRVLAVYWNFVGPDILGDYWTAEDYGGGPDIGNNPYRTTGKFTVRAWP